MGLALAVVVETVVLHVWLYARHPSVAWTLTCMSVLTLVWLAGDYRGMGRSAVIMHADRLDLRIGLRGEASIPFDAIIGITRPTWKDLPRVDTGGARDYRNLTKPAEPNVLIVLREAIPVLVARSVQVPVRRIGLHLDEPEAFMQAVAPLRGADVRVEAPGAG